MVRSPRNIRSTRGENCPLDSCNTRMVIENTRPVNEIIAWMIEDRKLRAPAGGPGKTKTACVAGNASSSATSPIANPTEMITHTAGTSQNVDRATSRARSTETTGSRKAPTARAKLTPLLTACPGPDGAPTPRRTARESPRYRRSFAIASPPMLPLRNRNDPAASPRAKTITTPPLPSWPPAPGQPGWRRASVRCRCLHLDRSWEDGQDCASRSVSTPTAVTRNCSPSACRSAP